MLVFHWETETSKCFAFRIKRTNLIISKWYVEKIVYIAADKYTNRSIHRNISVDVSIGHLTKQTRVGSEKEKSRTIHYQLFIQIIKKDKDKSIQDLT